LLNQIGEAAGLSHTSLKHIKWFLVAALNFAKQIDALQTTGNPVDYTEVPEGAATEQTKAYSLREISSMIAALADDPVASAIIATAAFTGLCRSELRGLRWSDFRDSHFFVSRTVWNTSERDKTKTIDAKAPVPVLKSLAKILEPLRGDWCVFAGPKNGRPLNLANLARRVIVPRLKAAGVQCWLGWHGFRRSLATNLFELGEDEATIQAILRHADVKTTRRHYIKKNVVSKESKQAMNRLAQVFKKMQKPSRRLSALGANVGTSRSRKTQKSQ
jgi:integrase